MALQPRIEIMAVHTKISVDAHTVALTGVCGAHPPMVVRSGRQVCGGVAIAHTRVAVAPRGVHSATTHERANERGG